MANRKCLRPHFFKRSKKWVIVSPILSVEEGIDFYYTVEGHTISEVWNKYLGMRWITGG